MELREPLVPDLPRHKVFRDDSLRLATSLPHGVRDNPHQTHVAAAVHQSNFPSHQFRSHLLGGSAVFRTATRTGAAENADSFHAVILNRNSTSEEQPRGTAPTRVATHRGARTRSRAPSTTNMATLQPLRIRETILNRC